MCNATVLTIKKLANKRLRIVLNQKEILDTDVHLLLKTEHDKNLLKVYKNLAKAYDDVLVAEARLIVLP